MSEGLFLVDTSTWIEALRRNGKPQAREWLRRALLEERVVMVHPVKAELLSGTTSEKQFAELKKELDALPLLGREKEAWDIAAKLNFKLRRQGITVPLVDVLIASWALLHRCTLAHHDRHYEMIKEAGVGLSTVVVPS